MTTNDSDWTPSYFLSRGLDDVEDALKVFSDLELAGWRLRLAQIDALIVKRLNDLRHTK